MTTAAKVTSSFLLRRGSREKKRKGKRKERRWVTNQSLTRECRIKFYTPVRPVIRVGDLDQNQKFEMKFNFLWLPRG
jgi:hypothetical protein